MLYNAVGACLESWIVRGTPASTKGKGGGAEQNASNRGSGNNIGTRHKSQHFGIFQLVAAVMFFNHLLAFFLLAAALTLDQAGASHKQARWQNAFRLLVNNWLSMKDIFKGLRIS